MGKKEKLTLWQAVSIGLGNIIGAGIFVLAGLVIYQSGPGALLSFILTGILATTVALNSAELSSKIITHGGLYSFVKETMGDSLGFVVGWLRSISYAIAGAAVSIGFSSYLLSIWNISSNSLIVVIAIMLILVITLIDYIGIKMVAKIEQTLVTITVLGLVIFIIVSFFYGKWEVSRFTPILPKGPLSIVYSASLAFFAYSGFNTIATLTPEVENGAKNAPKAIMISLAISTVLYILVVIGMLAMMPWYLYGMSGSPLSNAMMYSHAPFFIIDIVSLVAIVSTFTVTMSLIVAGSRTLLQMCEDGMLPKWIGHADSPKRSVVIIGAVTVFSVFLGNLNYIVLASNFGVIFSYALTGIAVGILRKRKILKGFNSPWYPYIQISSVVLSMIVMLSLGIQSLYLGTMLIIVGIILYAIEKEKVIYK
ncbi:MAG: APC family permease [Thermoplasmata archaeon]